jgi:hypothetical protein
VNNSSLVGRWTLSVGRWTFAAFLAACILLPSSFLGFPWPAYTSQPAKLTHIALLVLDHVADANARLSIDPSGKVAGYRVIQDDLPATYEFLGAGADADAGLWVTGAGTSEYNGPYTYNGSNYSQLKGVSASCATGGDGGIDPFHWAINTDVYRSNDAPPFAWQAEWIAGPPATGAPPAPTVTRNPIASEANWQIVP